MKKISFALVLSSVAVLALSACDTPYTATHLETKNAHYWQRTEASSAIYQRGPKAEQMLQRDIASCVYQIRELQRLGAIQSATPGDIDINGKEADPKTPAGRLAAQDTPTRDEFLYVEQNDFHDFETCMNTKGWERVQYLPYSIADEARANYIETMKSEQRRKKSGEQTDIPAKPKGPYDNLNQ